MTGERWFRSKSVAIEDSTRLQNDGLARGKVKIHLWDTTGARPLRITTNDDDYNYYYWICFVNINIYIYIIFHQPRFS